MANETMTMEEADKFVKEFVGPTFSIFRMAPEERAAIMTANPPSVDLISMNIYLDWSWKACGFGQLSVTLDRKTGKITCSNEGMGRERIRQMLHVLADQIADTAILDSTT